MLIDIILLLVALYGFYLGFADGIIKTVMSFMSYAFGLMAAIKFTPAMTQFIKTGFSTNAPFIMIIAFIVTFFLSMYIIRLIADAMTNVLQFVHINILNQIIGGVFLSFAFVTVYSVLVWFGESTSLISPQTAAQSYTLPFLRPLPTQAQVLFSGLKPMFVDFWQESGSMMDKIERKTVQRKEGQSDIYNIPDGYQPDAKPQNPNPPKEEGKSWWFFGKEEKKAEEKKVEKKESDWQIYDIPDEKPRSQR